ncbi:unnamed protein product [Owenia fusiformis]|uniref:Uncharacterized protein n=1 Tax=Owenia fusiformis TaxID=6347 RepID=A0A8J1UAV0_OWEFU|nr:unnamed protein product [Owenia fusiformis]
MDYFIMDVGGARRMCSDLGYMNDGEYMLADNSADVLEDIIEQLSGEAPACWTFRQQLGIEGIVHKDLVLAFQACATSQDVFALLVKLFVLLTEDTPRECENYPEIALLHTEVIDAFCSNKDMVEILVGELGTMLEENGEYDFDEERIRIVNDMFLLIRNILYETSPHQKTHLYLFALNLFENDLGAIISAYLKRSQLGCWSNNITQVLALLFPMQAEIHEKGLLEREKVSRMSRVTSSVYTTSQLKKSRNTIDVKSAKKLCDHIYTLRAEVLEMSESLLGKLEMYVKQLEDENASNYYLWLIGDLLKAIENSDKPHEQFRKFPFVKTMEVLLYMGTTELEILATKDQTERFEIARHRFPLIAGDLKIAMVTLLSFTKTELSDENADHLIQTIFKLSEQPDMGRFFVLAITQCMEGVLEVDPLKHLIMANHNLLLLIDLLRKSKLETGFDIKKHVEMFASRNIMAQYGRALEAFETNGFQLNECICTMMYHIAGDCDAIDFLLQPEILMTFMNIMDQEFWFSVEHNDMIECVMNQFLKRAENDPENLVNGMVGNLPMDSDDSETSDSSCSDEGSSDATMEDECEIDPNDLETIIELSNETDDISELVRETGKVLNIQSVKQISSKLYSLGLITGSDIDSLLPQVESRDANLENIMAELTKGCLGYGISFLKSELLEAVYVKLGGRKLSEENVLPASTVMSQCHGLWKDIPIIHYTEAESRLLDSAPYTKLLKTLGLKSPYHIYPRIPHDLSPWKTYELASLLGPIDEDQLKFNVEQLKLHAEGKLKLPAEEIVEKFTSLSVNEKNNSSRPNKKVTDLPSDMWLYYIQKNNLRQQEGATATQQSGMVG